MISVAGRFVAEILAGTKSVELRRRAPKVSVGTTIWIYEKAPVASVRAVADLATVETLAPDAMWATHAKSLGLSRSEFDKYVAGRDAVTALSLAAVKATRPVTLNDMRRMSANFHPPQFYRRLDTDGPFVETLRDHLHP